MAQPAPLDHRMFSGLERFDLDVAELDILTGVLQADGAVLECRMMGVQYFRAVIEHHEMIALRRHFEGVPLVEHDFGLVVALEMAREAARVIVVVVVRFPGTGLVTTLRTSNW